MKRSVLIHLLWLGIATGTYFLGAHRSNTSKAPDGSYREVTTPSLLSGRSSSRSSNDPAGATGAGIGDSTSTGAAQRNPNTPPSVQDLVKEATSSNPISRSKAMAELLANLTSENAPEVLGSMHQAGAEDEQMGLLVYAWAALDGEAAMAFADEVGDAMNEEERSGYKRQVITGWASANPNEARAWVDALDADDPMTGRFRWSLVSGMADGDVEVATAYALERAEANDRGAPYYMDRIAERMLKESGVAESVGWAEDLPEGGAKTAALRRVATDFVDESPEGAAEWATQYVDEDHGTRVIQEVSDEWAERDAAAAVAWLETLPDGDAKSAGMAAALTEWVRRGDAVAASEYLAEMPASPERDQAVAGFSRTLAHSDPQSAITWAESIQQDASRQSALIDAGRAWMRRDPAAASAWLQGSTLGEEAAQKITAPSHGDRERR